MRRLPLLHSNGEHWLRCAPLAHACFARLGTRGHKMGHNKQQRPLGSATTILVHYLHRLLASDTEEAVVQLLGIYAPLGELEPLCVALSTVGA